MNLPAIAPAEPQRHALSVDDVLRMVGAGILEEDARIELIEGELIDMTAASASHAALRNRLARMFVLALGERGVVSIQNALRLGNFTLPQPDLCALRAQSQDYFDRLPTAADVLLLIEVSDSTLRYDRDRKLPLYARHGIAEVWIVDVNARRTLRYTQPDAEAYAREDVITGKVALTQLPDCIVDLTPLFPPGESG